MAYASQLSLKELDREEASLVVISPNDPEAMKKYVRECQELEQAYIYDPSQQIVRLAAEDIRQGVESCLALFVNDYEYALIRKMTGLTTSGILKHARFMVVTRGESGAVVYSRDGEFTIPVVPPEKIADPTGVGDAFRGGFITAFQSGLDWKTCGRMGALAATYCLENTGPQGHHYTIPEFIARYRRNFDDEGKLDILLKWHSR
jgi:adenosine kinase